LNPGDLQPDIHFTPTPPRVITEMLRIASVDKSDVVFDLGSGDGRLVIAAAERGACGVGIDIDPQRIQEALANAARAGVERQVEFRREDFFASDLRSATVIALYLLDSLNVRLRPKIFAECRPGTRVVSYSFEMGEWPPDAHTPIAANGVSLWIVPANLSGTWHTEGVPGGAEIEALHLTQTFQTISGDAVIGGETRAIRDGRVCGNRFSFTIDAVKEADALRIFGTADGEVIRRQNAPAWQARRAIGTSRSIES
jgi:SAM-dependent methyltransferase